MNLSLQVDLGGTELRRRREERKGEGSEREKGREREGKEQTRTGVKGQ